MPSLPVPSTRSASSPEPFQQDPARGRVSSPGGERFTVVPVDFIRRLPEAIRATFGERTRDALYRTGYEWGLQAMAQFSARLRAASPGGQEVWRMEAKNILDSWWASFATAGWGTCVFDLGGIARGLVIVELRNSAVVAALGVTEQPVCDLYAGLFAGALSFCEREERHAVEVQCAAAGQDPCKFAVGPGADVDAVETWRQKGDGPADILRRLR
jgi:uncharacterized protein